MDYGHDGEQGDGGNSKKLGKLEPSTDGFSFPLASGVSTAENSRDNSPSSMTNDVQ